MARAIVPLTEAQRGLAERFIPLALAIAKPFKQQIPDCWDEFESAALLALTIAAGRYDPASGIKFATFAWRRIDWALRDTRCRRRLRAKRTVNRSDLDPSSVSAILTSPDTRWHPAAPDPDEGLESIVRTLPPAHAETLRLLYRDDLTRAEAARVQGVSTPLITRRHRDALAMLREA